MGNRLYSYFTSFAEVCPSCSNEKHFYCSSKVKTMLLEAIEKRTPQIDLLFCGLRVKLEVTGKKRKIEETHYRTDIPCEKCETEKKVCLVNG